MRIARLGFFFATAAFAACSGSAMNPVTAIHGTNDIVAAPPTVDASFWSHARYVSFPIPPALRGLALLAREFHTAGRNGSTVGPNDSEVLGTLINGGGSYTGLYGQQTAYTAQQFGLPYPSGGSGTQLLLAPISLPPNGGCLSAGTMALNGGTQPANYFVAINYCGSSPQLVAATPIDSNFLNSYVRLAPDGSPLYTILNITPDATPTSQSTWYVFLQDFALRSWDAVAHVKGIAGSSTGYSFFRSAYLPGKCPDGLPQVAAETLMLYNSKTKAFEPLTPTMSGTTTVALAPRSGTSCFNADQSGPATSTFDMVIPNSNWWARFGPQLYAANHGYVGMSPSPPPERLSVYPHPFDNSSKTRAIVTSSSNNFCGVAVDHQDINGRVYVSTCFGPVNVYPRPEVSMSTPLFSITGFANTQNLGFDSLGNLYVPDPFRGVYEVARPITPSSVPQLLPLGSLNQSTCVAVDNAQNLYVIDSNAQLPYTLKMYGSSHSGNPIATINVGGATSCAIDPITQRLYIAATGATNTVAGYATPLTSGASPVVTLSFGSPGVMPASVFGIGFDANGTLYVNVNWYTLPPPSPVISSIDVFAQPIASGTPGPVTASFPNEDNQFTASQIAVGP